MIGRILVAILLMTVIVVAKASDTPVQEQQETHQTVDEHHAEDGGTRI